MRRLMGIAALFGALSLSSPSFAQEGGEHPAGEAADKAGEAHGEGHGAAHEGATHEAGEHAEAHEHEGGGIENWWTWNYKEKHLPPPFGFALINFAIFAAIMYKLAAKPLKSFVRDRHDQIRKALDEAAKLRREAEAKLKEYEKKVANVDAEIEALLTSIKQEAEAEKARLQAAAEAQAKKLKVDAQKQIEAEIVRAREELRATVVEAAISSAEQILRSQTAPDDQRKMAERYVANIEETAATKRTA
jgi:F-type H+-transporting ATPase subunit b